MTDIEDLCDDVLIEVCGFLPFQEMLALRIVSKNFNSLLSNETVWKFVMLNRFPILNRFDTKEEGISYFQLGVELCNRKLLKKRIYYKHRLFLEKNLKQNDNLLCLFYVGSHPRLCNTNLDDFIGMSSCFSFFYEQIYRLTQERFEKTELRHDIEEAKFRVETVLKTKKTSGQSDRFLQLLKKLKTPGEILKEKSVVDQVDFYFIKYLEIGEHLGWNNPKSDSVLFMDELRADHLRFRWLFMKKEHPSITLSQVKELYKKVYLNGDFDAQSRNYVVQQISCFKYAQFLSVDIGDKVQAKKVLQDTFENLIERLDCLDEEYYKEVTWMMQISYDILKNESDEDWQLTMVDADEDATLEKIGGSCRRSEFYRMFHNSLVKKV